MYEIVFQSHGLIIKIHLHGICKQAIYILLDSNILFLCKLCKPNTFLYVH